MSDYSHYVDWAIGYNEELESSNGHMFKSVEELYDGSCISDIDRINKVKQQIAKQRKFAGNGKEVCTTHLTVDIEEIIKLAELYVKNNNVTETNSLCINNYDDIYIHRYCEIYKVNDNTIGVRRASEPRCGFISFPVGDFIIKDKTKTNFIITIAYYLSSRIQNTLHDYTSHEVRVDTDNIADKIMNMIATYKECETYILKYINYIN